MYKGNCGVNVIFGKRGGGKSFLAAGLVDRLDCSRVLYYDSNGHDYTGGVICEGLEQLKEYARRVVDGPFSIVYRSSRPRADFETVCKIVRAAGDVVFIVDEVDMYFKDSEPGEAFGDLIRRGRHDDIELIGITQRPRQMGEIRSMANMLYVFETHEQSDLSYFRQSFSDGLVERIKQLKKYEYIKVPLPYDESQLEICKEAEKGGYTASDHRNEVDQQSQPGDTVGLQPANSDKDREDQ